MSPNVTIKKLLDDGDDLDLDLHAAGGRVVAGGVAGGAVVLVGEEFEPGLVERLAVAEVGEEAGEADDVVRRRARVFQEGAHVAEALARLLVDVVRELAGVGVDALYRGAVDDVADARAVGDGGVVLHAGDVDGLPSAHGLVSCRRCGGWVVGGDVTTGRTRARRARRSGCGPRRGR